VGEQDATVSAATVLRTVVLCALASSALTNGMSGQQQSKPLVPVLEEAQRLNWMVRIEDEAGHRSQGRIVDQGDTLVRIGRSVVDLRGVQQVFHGSREGSGALPGGLVGGAMLGGLALAGSAGCVNECSTLAITGFSTAVGLFLGLIVGDVVNPGHLVWREVWP
jgi:hypothetical protein